MDDLRRELAPVSSEAWEAIDEEARRVFKVKLAARKLVDFHGPLGWKKSSVELGRVERLATGPADGVEAGVRKVQPLLELRAPFDLSRAELESVARGNGRPDLSPLVDAASRMARAEDRAVFHGYPAGGIAGIVESSIHSPLPIPGDHASFPPPIPGDHGSLPATVAEATRLLRAAGVDGPFAIALGPKCYVGLVSAARGGWPVDETVRRLLDGPVVLASVLDGALVMSVRGGDYELTVGRDLSIGYCHHTADSVRLFLLESMTFRPLTPEAAIALEYRS